MRLLVNVAMLLIISTLWAIGLATIEELVKVFPPISLGAWRASIASITILIFCIASRQKLVPAFKRSGAMAFLGAVGIVTLWSMVPIAEKSIDSALATLLVAVVPFAALVVIALPPISARVHWLGWVGLILGTTGLALAVGPSQLFHNSSTFTGVVWGASGYICFGVYCVMTEKFMKSLAPAPAAGVSIFYAGIILWGLAFMLESPLDIHPSANDWFLLLAFSLICTAIPNLLVYVLAKRAGGVFVSFYGYIMPIIGIAIGYFYFHTPVVWTLFLGVPLTFIGMAMVQRAQKKAKEQH